MASESPCDLCVCARVWQSLRKSSLSINMIQYVRVSHCDPKSRMGVREASRGGLLRDHVLLTCCTWKELPRLGSFGELVVA